MPVLFALIIDDSGTLSINEINREIDSYKKSNLEDCKEGSLYLYRIVNLPRFFVRGSDLSEGVFIPQIFVKQSNNVRLFDIIDHCLNDIKSVRRLSDNNVKVHIISALKDDGNGILTYDGIMEKIAKLNQLHDYSVTILPKEAHKDKHDTELKTDTDKKFMNKMIDLFTNDPDPNFPKHEQHQLIIDYFKLRIRK